MKSFLSTGRWAASRALRKSLKLPRKNASSVSTDMAAAPADSYLRAYSAGSRSARMTPFEGEARLISAMIFTPCRPGCASDAPKGRTSILALARCSRSAAGTTFFASATSAFFFATIRSRMLTPITRFPLCMPPRLPVYRRRNPSRSPLRPAGYLRECLLPCPRRPERPRC